MLEMLGVLLGRFQDKNSLIFCLENWRRSLFAMLGVLLEVVLVMLVMLGVFVKRPRCPARVVFARMYRGRPRSALKCPRCPARVLLASP